jgi:hypothetical protein
MAIGTYGQLKTAVANWLKRTDLTDIIPDFITLAESNIRRDVRCRAMEQTATGTLSGSTLALPTRFLEARNVAIDSYPQVYVTPQEFTQQTDWQSGNFTIKGESFYFQATSGDYSIDYWQAFEAFSADGDTNWLLTNAPEVYLWAAIAEAKTYIEGDPSAAIGFYNRAVVRLRQTEMNARFAGPLRVRADGVIA